MQRICVYCASSPGIRPNYSLLSYFDHAIAEGLLTAASRAMLQSSADPATLLEMFRSHVPPQADKWQ